MNIATNEITGRTPDQITTEIMFFVVSARSMNMDLIKLKFKRENDELLSEKDIALVSKILRLIKRRKLIQLFVASQDFDERITEMEYLLNKYPNLPEELTSDVAFILKL